jgi:hypothetical protein
MVKNISGVKLTHNQKVKCVYRKDNVFSYFTMDGEKKMQAYFLLVHHVTPYSH